MKSFNLRFQAVVAIISIVLVKAEDDYENKLTKLWSMTGAASGDGSAVLNVTSASIVIQPSSYSSESQPRATRPVVYQRYAFKPRPSRRQDQPSQVERSVYYSPDKTNKYKSEVLFPGNYFQIAKEKSNENATKESPQGEVFHPKSIPLIRTQEFQKRSLDVATEPIGKQSRDLSEQQASRRSISYLFGDLEDGDEEEDREEAELDADDSDEVTKQGFKSKKPKIKKSKLKKYVIPLLLAYKLKYFALVPVLIGGLVLLVGATGLAGFFFALFAAVMGLQKGGY
ncbi:hypothetical protein ACJJTC_014138 [Scirpophaga incertulas]